MDQRDNPQYREGQSELSPLKRLQDWQVAQGDPDIRGWDILDQNNERIGQVDDLIINKRTSEAEYIVARYGGGLGMGAKDTLMPIDNINVDRNRKVVVSDFPADSLRSAPEYNENTRDYGAFGSFWAGVIAAAAARGREAREQPREGVFQKFVHRMEGQPEQRGEPEVQAEQRRRVRVHLAHRTLSGDEVPLNEGDVIEIPVLAGRRGGARTEEIVIRLESVEEGQDDETHQYRVS